MAQEPLTDVVAASSSPVHFGSFLSGCTWEGLLLSKVQYSCAWRKPHIKYKKNVQVIIHISVDHMKQQE